MHNQSISYNNDDSLSFEQPTYERFYIKNVDVLRKLLKLSNQEVCVGLPKSNTFQESMKMRSLMINWLKQVNSFRSSKPGVLALTIEIVDHYVFNSSSTRDIDSTNYQLVGASGYHLASKIEEVTPISASDMARFTSATCTASEIMDFEVIISCKLGYNTKFVTPVDFIYLLIGFLDLQDESMELTKCAVNCYLDIINEFYVKKFASHVIAVSCIIIAYHDFEDYFDKTMDFIVSKLVTLTNLERNEISTCYDLINGIIDEKKGQCSDQSAENINTI